MRIRTPTHCYEPTREAAMAVFAKAGGENERRGLRLPARFRTIQVCPKDLPILIWQVGPAV
jgi:hypothetical protein